MSLVVGDVADVGDIPDPRAGAATITFRYPSVAGGASSSPDFSDHLLVFGGVGLSEYYNDLHVMDVRTLVWHNWTHLTSGESPSPRGSMSHGFLAQIVLYIFGGRGGGGVTNDVWLFDPATKHWAELTPVGTHVPAPREDAATLLVDDVKFLIYGGSTERGTTMRDMWLFDTLSNVWVEIVQSGDMPRCGLAASTATLLDKQRAVFVGGYDGESYKNDVRILELGSFFWRRVEVVDTIDSGSPGGGVPRPRTHCVIHRLNSRQIFIFAGYCGAVALHDAWVFEINSQHQGSWETVSLGQAPLTARGAPSFTYSFDSGLLYVVGGCNGHQFLSSLTGFEFPVLAPEGTAVQNHAAPADTPEVKELLERLHQRTAAMTVPHNQQHTDAICEVRSPSGPSPSSPVVDRPRQRSSSPLELSGTALPSEPRPGTVNEEHEIDDLNDALKMLKGTLTQPVSVHHLSQPRREPSLGVQAPTLVTSTKEDRSGRQVLWHRADHPQKESQTSREEKTSPQPSSPQHDETSVSPFSTKAALLTMPEVVRILKQNDELKKENADLQRTLALMIRGQATPNSQGEPSTTSIPGGSVPGSRVRQWL